jgi:hypothetical protein
VAVVIPECVIGLSIAVDNAGAPSSPFSFHCTVHQINDSRRSEDEAMPAGYPQERHHSPDPNAGPMHRKSPTGQI